MKEEEFGAMFENVPLIEDEDLPLDMFMIMSQNAIADSIKQLGLEGAIRKASEKKKKDLLRI